MLSLVRFIEHFNNKISVLLGKGWVTELGNEVGFIHRLLEKAPSDVELCIDIGGNHGDYTTELLKQFPMSKVVVFEPSKTNVFKLEQRFEGNDRVSIVPKAVGEQNTNALLFSDELGSGMGSLTKRRLDHFNISFDASEPVSVLRFEDYWTEVLNQKPIDICKLDIEGHEFEALKGFGKALDYIQIIQFEFGGTQIDSKTFFQDFWYLLNSYEFDIYRMSPLGLIKVEKYKESDEYFAYTNFLAKKRK